MQTPRELAQERRQQTNHKETVNKRVPKTPSANLSRMIQRLKRAGLNKSKSKGMEQISRKKTANVTRFTRIANEVTMIISTKKIKHLSAFIATK